MFSFLNQSMDFILEHRTIHIIATTNSSTYVDVWKTRYERTVKSIIRTEYGESEPVVHDLRERDELTRLCGELEDAYQRLVEAVYSQSYDFSIGEAIQNAAIHQLAIVLMLVKEDKRRIAFDAWNERTWLPVTKKYAIGSSNVEMIARIHQLVLQTYVT